MSSSEPVTITRKEKPSREPARVVETRGDWTITEHPSARPAFRFQASAPWKRGRKLHAISGPTLSSVLAYL